MCRSSPYSQSYPWGETFRLSFLFDAALTVSIILRSFVLQLQETCKSWGCFCCCIPSKAIPPPGFLVPMVTVHKMPSQGNQLIASAAQQAPGVTEASGRDPHALSAAFKPAFKRKGAKLETGSSSSNQGGANPLPLRNRSPVDVNSSCTGCSRIVISFHSS